MGNLGFIGGESSDDLMDGLSHREIVDLGIVAEMKDFSKSMVYATPNDIFVLLLEEGHSDTIKGQGSQKEYTGMARDLLKGASVDEMFRFMKLVVGAKDYLQKVLSAGAYQSSDVEGAMSSLREQYQHALEGKQASQAEDLLGTTEDFLNGLSADESGLDLKEVYTNAVKFSFAVETVGYKATGMEL